MARDQTWLALGVGIEVLATVHGDIHLSFGLPLMYHLTKEINELILLPESFYDGHGLALGRVATFRARLTIWLRLALFCCNRWLVMSSLSLLMLFVVASMV